MNRIVVFLSLWLLVGCNSGPKETCFVYDSNTMYKEIIEAYPSGDTQAVHVFYKAEQGNSLYGFQSYYPDGNVKVQGCLRSPKIRVGVWESFYQNGKPWSIGTYDTAGVQTGIKRVWYENGQVRYQGQMENGKPAGEWEYFDENGKKKQ